jgi:hypothetical protein
MTISAYGDLDCDGIFSTFQIHLRGDPACTSGFDCEKVGSETVIRENETE